MLDMDKQLSISEAAEITGYPPHVLRYYEKEFELDIPRNESNHRYFTYKEIEMFQYIKILQEKGFSNKQIKLIIESPELVIDDEDEVAFTSIVSREKVDLTNLTEEISVQFQEQFVGIKEQFINELIKVLETNSNYNAEVVEQLKEEIMKLRNELNNKERDVLICENAKLKMKVKEKTYEIIKLKEELNKIKNTKNPFKRLFGG